MTPPLPLLDSPVSKCPGTGPPCCGLWGKTTTFSPKEKIKSDEQGQGGREGDSPGFSWLLPPTRLGQNFRLLNGDNKPAACDTN